MSRKTVVGLLIAQSSLNEGVGPVAYLVPDSYLVDQVVGEANALGIAVTTDAKATNFRAGKVILVATFDKVVNGRTVFGLAGSPAPVVLGTVVVDDAHTAVARAQDKFRLRVPARIKKGNGDAPNPAFDTLLAAFAEDMKAQNRKNHADLAAGDWAAPMRVPYWAWASRQDQIIEVLSQLAATDPTGVGWAWPLVSDHLLASTATFTSRELEIRPLCPPIAKVPAIDQATRRIYLTATLADDGILVTELNANPDSVRKPITPGRAADLGDRLILAPLALNQNMIEDTVRQMVRGFADGDWDGDGDGDHDAVNVVVLVPSDKAAAAWSGYADHTLHVDDMKPVLDQMPHTQVGLVVLVNKYDGVDLPHEACRVLVVDGIPTPLTPSERRESAALSGSATFRASKIQRIEQGMGRGIRDADDYCAVLLLGTDLALSQVEAGSLAVFSPATRTQIELSQSLSEQIKGEGTQSIRDALTMFLERDEDWLTLSRGATSAVEYAQEGHVAELAIARRRAFDTAEAGDHAEAADILSAAANTTSNPAENGWVLEESATYRHQVDPARAQATQRAAKTANKQLLLPTAAVAYKPLTSHTVQAAAVSAYLTSQYATGPELILGLDNVLNSITWDPELTDASEEAFRKLGEHLGFVSSRPDKERNEGPDNLWNLSTDVHAIIEAKTGVTRSDTRISKTEADQLSGSINWHKAHYPDVTTRVPVMFHPGSVSMPDAFLPEGTRVVTATELNALREAVRQFAREIGVDNAWKSPEIVKDALQTWKLTPNAIIHAYSTRST